MQKKFAQYAGGEIVILKQIFLAIIGASYGMLAAAGVFTVLVAVGLVPRFAGKTHTAKHVLVYEEMVVFGTIFGGLISVFPEYSQVAASVRGRYPDMMQFWEALGVFGQIIYGLFRGMFTGCLALAIAETLDSIPIFTRRISFRHGIGLAILSMAVGKVCGSLIYFWTELYRVMQ